MASRDGDKGPEDTPQLPENVPLTRDIRRPYFLVRAPDRVHHYLEKENYRILTSLREPLARFLARGTLIESGRDRTLKFDLAAYASEDLRQMEDLPLSEIEAFEEAARGFYEKAYPEAENIPGHEKELRKFFKLPDPELEPDAYWVYGPRYAPRLLILWGCEQKEFSSLALIRDERLSIPSAADGGAQAATISERLRERITPWAAMRKDTFERLMDTQAPLSRFLFQVNRTEDGDLVTVENRFETIGAKALKPLKSIMPGQAKAFPRAAVEFYEKAHPENESLDQVEKEYRRRFRLADPDESPESFSAVGSIFGKRLVIILDDRDEEEKCLPLVDDEKLNIPPRPEKTVTGVETLDTVADKLDKRTLPVAKLTAIGIVAAVIAIGLASYLFDVFRDKVAPTLAEDPAVNAEKEPTRVTIRFSEEIDEKSINEADRFAIEGGEVEILERTINPEDRTQVILATSALNPTQKYIMKIRGVTDRAGNSIEANTTYPFSYLDTLPPEVVEVSASGESSHQLVLFFSEPLASREATLEANYKVAGEHPQSARLAREGNQVTLNMLSEMADGERYTLQIDNLSDRAEPANPMPAYREEFSYIDRIPPRVAEVVADHRQTELKVRFNEPVRLLADPPSSSFAVDGLAIYDADLSEDGKTAILKSQAMAAGVSYSLSVARIADRSFPTNVVSVEESLRTDFSFTGRVDRDPPEITGISSCTDDGSIVLIFNEASTAESVGG